MNEPFLLRKLIKEYLPYREPKSVPLYLLKNFASHLWNYTKALITLFFQQSLVNGVSRMPHASSLVPSFTFLFQKAQETLIFSYMTGFSAPWPLWHSFLPSDLNQFVQEITPLNQFFNVQMTLPELLSKCRL